MRKLGSADISVGIICMVTTYIIACQFSSIRVNDKNDFPEKMRIEELQAQLTLEKEKNKDVIEQLIETQKNLENYRNASNTCGYANNPMAEELDKARIIAGLTEVEGQGVTVNIDDSEEINFGSDKYAIVHDSDLRMVLCELAAAGAEAMSINGQRIIATTAVRCVGNTIMTNDVKIAPPFEIMAIGDSSTLEAAINIKGGSADYLRGWGLSVAIKKSDNIKIPRYKGVINMKYGSPVIDEEVSK